MARGFSKIPGVESVHLHYLSNKGSEALPESLEKDIINLSPIHIPGYGSGSSDESYLRFMYKVLIANRVLTVYFLWLLIFEVSKDDIVYIRGEQPGVAAYIASLFKDIDYIFEKHNFEFGDNKPKDFEYRKIFGRASLLVTVSKYTAKNWVDNGVEDSKIKVFQSGVNLEKFGPKKTDVDIGGEKNSFKIMYTGHLYERKGVDTLIEAAEILEDEGFEFFIIGGLEKDIEKYQNKVEQRGLDNFNLLGYKQHQEIPNYLAAADLLVLPNKPYKKKSRLHTSPVKLAEYLATGKPILASDLPSIRQIVSERECFFFTSDDAEDLSTKLKTIRSNSSEAEQKAKFGETLAKEYSWLKRCERILEVLEKESHSRS